MCEIGPDKHINHGLFTGIYFSQLVKITFSSIRMLIIHPFVSLYRLQLRKAPMRNIGALWYYIILPHLSPKLACNYKGRFCAGCPQMLAALSRLLCLSFILPLCITSPSLPYQFSLSSSDYGNPVRS